MKSTAEAKTLYISFSCQILPGTGFVVTREDQQNNSGKKEGGDDGNESQQE